MDDRPDLAAMVSPLNKALLSMEEPILESHGISMWAYVVLSRLAARPYRGQAVLADEIGADKTRLIDVLDDLQGRGLISREPDPADRRARLLAITPKGRSLRDRVHRAIRREEEKLLAELPAADRTALLRALPRLLRAAAPDGWPGLD